jgi:hypothetical protein
MLIYTFNNYVKDTVLAWLASLVLRNEEERGSRPDFEGRGREGAHLP